MFPNTQPEGTLLITHSDYTIIMVLKGQIPNLKVREYPRLPPSSTEDKMKNHLSVIRQKVLDYITQENPKNVLLEANVGQSGQRLTFGADFFSKFTQTRFILYSGDMNPDWENEIKELKQSNIVATFGKPLPIDQIKKLFEIGSEPTNKSKTPDIKNDDSKIEEKTLKEQIGDVIGKSTIGKQLTFNNTLPVKKYLNGVMQPAGDSSGEDRATSTDRDEEEPDTDGEAGRGRVNESLENRGMPI